MCLVLVLLPLYSPVTHHGNKPPPPPPPGDMPPPRQVLTDSGGKGGCIRSGCSRPCGFLSVQRFAPSFGSPKYFPHQPPPWFPHFPPFPPNSPFSSFVPREREQEFECQNEREILGPAFTLCQIRVCTLS